MQSILIYILSRNIQIKMPYSVERMPDELHYTYLDTVGRPVIVLKKSNLVEQHIQDFEVCFKHFFILFNLCFISILLLQTNDLQQ